MPIINEVYLSHIITTLEDNIYQKIDLWVF